MLLLIFAQKSYNSCKTTLHNTIGLTDFQRKLQLHNWGTSIQHTINKISIQCNYKLIFNAVGGSDNIEIVGERGNLRADLFSNKVTVISESGEAEKKFFPEFSRNDMYKDMLSEFTSCIEEKNVTPIFLQEGLISNRIAIDIRNEVYYENAWKKWNKRIFCWR